MIFGDRKEYIKDLPFFTKENCPFCILHEEDKELILKKTDFWEIRFNKFPYYGDKKNLLAFPIKHKVTTLELTDEERVDFKNVEEFMKNYFGDKNYFSFIRQGNGGRSIEHLHYHYLEGIIMHSSDDDKLFKIINT